MSVFFAFSRRECLPLNVCISKLLHVYLSLQSRSVDSSGANKGLVRTSFAGGSDMGSTKGDASADGGGPLVMVSHFCLRFNKERR